METPKTPHLFKNKHLKKKLGTNNAHIQTQQQNIRTQKNMTQKFILLV
jgi:hypothetical protein